MEETTDSETWELSKENIQPLKQGRNASVLSVALDESATRKLNSIRHTFEEELRTYSGDDPLDVWHRYALWVEQNYPKGGRDGNLKRLIQQCIKSIHMDTNTNEKYKNDPRFLALWVKFANLSPNSLEVYSAMESKDICTKLADFYISWSWEFERVGNVRRADAIYQKGVQVGAVPFDIMQDAHKKFQMRVARATVEGGITDMTEAENDPQRVALTALKVQGKKNRVANERVGSSVLGPAGRVSQPRPSGNAGGLAFSIYQDNGGTSAVDGGGHANGGALPIRNSLNKENVKDPTQWTKAKVSQKTTSVVPVEDLDKYQQPSFQVHEDEGASQLGRTPSKVPVTSNVLSVRKNKDDWDDWDVPLFIAEPFDPKVQPQYCKHKVYCGTEEFSLEELRAAQYMKKEKKEREEKAKKEKEEEERNAQFQEMQTMLRKQEEMIQQLLSMANNKDQNIPQVTVTSPLESSDLHNQEKQKKPEIGQNKDRSYFQDSWICMNKSVSASVNQSVNVSHFLDENSTRALLQLKPATMAPTDNEVPYEREQNASVSGPNVSGPDGLSNSHNSHSNSRGLNLTDPTVNTKMAMNAINEMWSASLFKDDSVAVAPETNVAATSEGSTPFMIFQDGDKNENSNTLPEKSAQPFTIFCDDGAKGNTEPTPAASFPIFEDKPCVEPKAGSVADPNHLYPENQDENAPPMGFTQEKKARPLAGILQPATNVPFCPLEDEREEEPEAKNVESQGTKREFDCDYEFDEDIFPLNDATQADFTLKMPNNPEAFAKNAKIASTPAWFTAQRNQGGSDDVGDLFKGGNFMPVEEEEEGKDESSGELMPPPSIINNPSHSPGLRVAPALSPIMEASREYKSSSSSSSGYSTTSTTLGTSSVHGLTQYGGLSTTHASRSRHCSNTQAEQWGMEAGATSHAGDFTKSGYLADKSRGESIAESRQTNVTSQSRNKMDDEELTFDPCQAAAMLMEMDQGAVSSAPKKDPMQTKAQSKAPKINLSGKINPFDEELLKKLLSSLEERVDSRGGYVEMAGKVPMFKPKMQLALGKEMFRVRCCRGEGAYAKAYQATTVDPLNVTIMPSNMDDSEDDDDDEHQVILKVQRPACPWEFYICHELRNRLKVQSYPVNMLDSMMRINRGYFYSNGSILANEYHKYGTLLDIVNGYKTSGQTIPESVAAIILVEVLLIVEALHSCDIIHADLKPDNFLVRSLPEVNLSAKTPEELFEYSPCALKLIDFGRSIDMKFFPEGTTFTEKVTTNGFTCCEMREGKPWTYETDYYGVAAIAYCFLFGSYMEVQKNKAGLWELKGARMKRHWRITLWQSLFSTLLNAPPPGTLQRLRRELTEQCFQLGMQDINSKIKSLETLLKQKK